MTGETIRILFFADTHLGFDHPVRPRIQRRRRGHDFFANYELILETAVREEVDCVVHGGDLFFRSKVPASLVQTAFLPIKKVADHGIPFLIVPGNHERSRIPYDMLALHPGVHIFDAPRTFYLDIGGLRVAFAGFPYSRKNVRSEFPRLVEELAPADSPADARLLCVHHCFEGAQVGVHNYTFRTGSDVVRANDVPGRFDVVLTGHVHRYQVLSHDLTGRVLDSPIIYSGSIERTAFAEREETKGFVIVNLYCDRATENVKVSWEFRELPTRTMVVRDLDLSGVGPSVLERRVRELLSRLPRDAVVQLRVRGKPRNETRVVMGAENMRKLAPPTMNLDLVFVDGERPTRRGRG